MHIYLYAANLPNDRTSGALLCIAKKSDEINNLRQAFVARGRAEHPVNRINAHCTHRRASVSTASHPKLHLTLLFLAQGIDPMAVYIVKWQIIKVRDCNKYEGKSLGRVAHSGWKKLHGSDAVTVAPVPWFCTMSPTQRIYSRNAAQVYTSMLNLQRADTW